MINCSVEENESGTDGGALSVDDGCYVAMFNCAFTQNRAGLGGGVLDLTNSHLYITKTTFRQNTAEVNNGGAIVADTNCVINISDTVFVNNSALNSGSGGALYASTRIDLHVTNVTFSRNFAAGQGSGLFVDRNSTITIRDSRFYDNYNDHFGGALGIDRNCLLVMFNSTCVGNRADMGGCVSIELSTVYFTQCTIQDNLATSIGGFVFASEVRLRIADSKSINNSAPKGADVYIEKFLHTEATNTQPESELLTFEALFKHGNLTLSSADKNFKQEALDNNVIYLKNKDIVVEETPYASGRLNFKTTIVSEI